jgi:hypothetical protein
MLVNVRYWHLADTDAGDADVCLWGHSGHPAPRSSVRL